MLVVTVEVWPGGSPLRKRNIGTLTLANVSELAEVSDYEGILSASTAQIPVTVTGHERADGAWKLVQTVLNEAGELPI